jgi:hypothetical protein
VDIHFMYLPSLVSSSIENWYIGKVVKAFVVTSWLKVNILLVLRTINVSSD